MQNVSLKSLQEDAADDIIKQTTFSDADFLGALWVKTFLVEIMTETLKVQATVR